MRVSVRSVLLIFFALLCSDSWAAKLYWIGGTGNFNDANHWSFESGGRGGAKSPTAADDVYFDEYSFNSKSVIYLIGNSEVNDLIFSDATYEVVFSGTQNEKITINGNLKFNPWVENQFLGDVWFKSDKASTSVALAKQTFQGNVYFEGNTNWTIKSNIVTKNNSTVYFNKGIFDLTNVGIYTYDFIAGKFPTTINASNTHFEVSNKFTLASGTIYNDGKTFIRARINNPAYYQVPQGFHFESVSKIANAEDQMACSITLTSATNASCPSGCDGIAVFNISAGCTNNPYCFDWNSSGCACGPPAQDCNVNPGNYTVTNISSCGSSYNLSITEAVSGDFVQSISVPIFSPSPFAINPGPKKKPSCNGLCDGFVTGNFSGGTSPYTVNWTGPVSASHAGITGVDTLKLACVGTYSVSVTDANGCVSSTATISLTQPSTLSVTPSVTNVLCNGTCTGVIVETLSGGTPPYGSFTWAPIIGTGTVTNTATTSTYSGLCATIAGTSYTFTAKDANNCPITNVSVVTEPTPITFTKNPASGTLNINCINNCNGSVDVSGVSGGTPNYTYTWTPATGNQSGGGTSSTYSGLCGTVAGIGYTCTIADANSCTVTATFTVKAPPALSHTITGSNPKCVAGQGVPTGSITVTEGGGSPNYTFTWNPPPPAGTQTSTTANPNTYTGVAPGSYTVNVIDSKGCLDSASVTLNPPVAVTGTITTQTNPQCPNLNNGQLCVTAGGGAGGFTYTWSPAPASGTSTCTASNLTVPIGGSSSYNVVITDANSCTLTVTGTLTSPTPATVTPAITDPKCGSAPCTGSATLNVAGGGGGGFTYAWSCDPSTGPTISGKCGGTSCNYTVTDAVTNCKYTGTVSFAPAPPTLTVNISATALNCAGDCSSQITSTVTGGTGAITYTWSPGPGNFPFINNQCAGNDTLRVTDANGCTQTATVNIASPPALTITMVPTQPTCANACNGSILVSVTGGAGPYPCTSWSPSIAPNSPTALNPTGLCGSVAGITYSVNICDSKGCKDSNSVTLITPPSLTVSVSTGAITCSGLCNGTATANVGGGVGPYTYSWDAAPFSPTDSTMAGLCAGAHSLDIKDANGCAGTTVVFNIVEPNPLSASVSNIVNTCGPCTGSAQTTPSGGTPPYSYTWTPGPGTVTSTSVTSTYSNLCIGNYTLTVGDTNNCPTVTVPFSINAIIAINIAASSQSVSCNNGSDGVADATASGGTPNYDMTWTSSPGGATVATCNNTPANCSAPGLPPGTYIITAVDAAGCINSDSIVIGNPPPFTVSGSQTDQKCFGSPCTGSATVTPAGGTPPYSITWTDGGPNGPVRSNLCPDIYVATLLDNKGCFASQTFTITSSPQFSVTSSTTSPVACGGVTGSIEVTASGGTAGYGFAWTGGGVVTTVSPTSTLTGVGAGVYTVTITDANLCDTVVQVTLSDPGTATVTATTQSVSCSGTCDGSTTVTAVGPAPITITWPNPVQSGPSPLTVNNLCANIYTVQTVDGNNCTQFFNDTIKGPLPITDGPVTMVQPNCSNLGSISFTEGGGSGGPYTFTWTPGSGGVGGNPRLNVPPGIDTVIIEDASGCTKAFTFTMNPASALTATISQTNNTCTYGCTGSATVAVVGGTPPYTYTWTSSAGNIPVGNTITNVSNLCPGSYSVTVNDNGGCSVVQTFTIVTPAAIVPNFSKKDNLCNTGCTGVGSVAPTGGTGAAYTYTWSPAIGNVTSTATTSTDSFMCPNNYTVFITDGAGCIDTTTFSIIQPSALTVQVDSTNPSCFGVCNGSATVTPSGGTGTTYTVTWAPNSNNCFGVSNCVASGLCDPTLVPQYTITTTDSNSCVNTHILVLVTPPKINANATTVDPLCFNDCNGSITSNTSGGNAPYTYAWTPATGVVSGVSPTSTYTNLCSGTTYSLMITDAAGCKDSSTYVLNNAAPITATTTSNPASCGATDGSIVIDNLAGNGAVTVLWLNPGSCTNSFTCSPLGFGVWSFEATDSKGCKDTFSVAVTNPTGPSIDSLVVHNTCNGISSGLITVTVTSGVNVVTPYTFSWTPAVTVVSTDTVSTNSGLAPGVYINTVTDSLGCGTATTFTVTEPPAIIDNGNATSATCVGINNGTITSIASGGTGTTYTYTLDGVTTNTTGIFPDVSAGTHTVCITDSLGCQKCKPYTIIPSTTIVDSISSTPLTCASVCSGIGTLVSVNGGAGPYTMVWSDGQVGATASNLCKGTYTVTITDTNGCQAIDSVTITAPAPITITTSSVNPTCGSCNGTLTVTPSGGIPGVTTTYTYLWSQGNATTADIDTVCAGIYQVAVTDSVGCSQTFLIPVSDSAAPTVTVAATTPACSNICNAVLTTTVTGGIAPYTYQWSTSPAQTTPSISGQCAGVYFVQVKDSVGCIATVPDTVKQGTVLTASLAIVNPDCDSTNGSVKAIVSGGSGSYSYNWSPNPSITDSIGPVGAGSYTVIVTDVVNGCVDTLSILLNSASGPNLTISSTSPLCNGICLGTASVSIFPVGTYTVNWSNGQSGLSIDSLCPGPNPYIVTVTDANGCVQTASTLVNDVSPLISSLPIITQPKCNGDCNGSITTIFTGGTPVYTYAWNPATVVGPGGSGLCANNYSVLVTDANGCTATEFDTLINPALLTITGTVTPSSCNTTPDAAINTTTNGGTPSLTAPGYTYTWGGGSTATTANLSNILSGNYTVVVADSKNCKDSASFVVTANITVTATTGNDTIICSTPNFVLNGDTTGATSVQWIQLPNPPGTVVGLTPTVTVSPVAGDTTQYVLVAQNGACSASDTITIISNTLPVPDAGNASTVFLGQPATIGGSPTNPGLTGTIVWQPNTNISDTTAANPTVTPSVTTTYTVFVTTPSGCTGWDTVTVTVLPTFVIPNGFSPNGDGYNETWQIDYIYMFPNCEVEVYNRWGEQLFYSKGYNIPWNGKYKGKDVPVGTYYYVIRLNDKKFPDHFTGPLTILR